jgi:hypothetical protein
VIAQQHTVDRYGLFTDRCREFLGPGPEVADHAERGDAHDEERGEGRQRRGLGEVGQARHGYRMGGMQVNDGGHVGAGAVDRQVEGIFLGGPFCTVEGPIQGDLRQVRGTEVLQGITGRRNPDGIVASAAEVSAAAERIAAGVEFIGAPAE